MHQHVYRTELQVGLCKVCALFDQNLGSKPPSKFVKTIFQDAGKSENIVKHETKEYDKDAIEEEKNFSES